MKNHFIAAAFGAALGIFATAQLAGPLLADEQQDLTATYEQLDLFGDVFDAIRAQYVEEVSAKELVEAAIEGMLTSLDPHSSYLDPEETADMRSNVEGEFGGVGIDVTMEEGVVRIISPRDGTPAAAAGLMAGDYITHANGETLFGLSLRDAANELRGQVGTEVVLTVVREGEPEPFEVSIIRDIIHVAAVRGRIEGEAIVLRISSFTEQTFPDLKEQLEKQVEEAGGFDNVSGFVIDLRNNPGGLLSQAVAVSDAFLTAGEIVSMRGRNNEDGQRWFAQSDDLTAGKPVVVLINEGSASASEIVAGALQDHRRGIVVGIPSFGKGSVQTLMEMRNQGTMRLTTARYYTPSGRSIQGVGITPDIMVAQPVPHQNHDADDAPGNLRSESTLRGALENDSMTEAEIEAIEADRERAETAAALRDEDFQLSYAIDLLTGLSALDKL